MQQSSATIVQRQSRCDHDAGWIHCRHSFDFDSPRKSRPLPTRALLILRYDIYLRCKHFNIKSTATVEQQLWLRHRRPRGNVSRNRMRQDRSLLRQLERLFNHQRRPHLHDPILICLHGHLAESAIRLRIAEAGTCA